MKERWKCKVRILSFILIFTMVMGMAMETVQLQAAETESKQVQKENITEKDPANDDRTEKPEFEVTVIAPEGPFYIGEVCKTPFTATVRETTQDIIVEDPYIEWSCTTSNADIDSSGQITVTARGEINIIAVYKDPNTEEVLGTSNPLIISDNDVEKRPIYDMTGIVQDLYSYENNPIAIGKAKVELIPIEGDQEGKTVYTDPNGGFLLKNVLGGNGTNYKIRISKEGKYNEKEIGDQFADLEEDFDLGVIRLETAEGISLEGVTEGENINLKVGDEKIINVICPEDWKKEITTSLENDTITAGYSNGQIILNGVKEGTTNLKISAHDREFSIVVDVKKYGNISGLISIEQSKEYYVNERIHIQAQFLAEGVLINDADKEVLFEVVYPDGTLNKLDSGSLENGIATSQCKFPYKGDYVIYCTLTGDEKYIDSCKLSMCIKGVKALESQKIKTIAEPNEPIGTYGDNEGNTEKIDFTAIVADADSNNFEKGWRVTVDDNPLSNDQYTVTIDKITDCKGLYDVKGHINLNAFKAGKNLRLLLEYAHTDNENQKVYENATGETVFSIKPKPLHVTEITFKDKIYDGTPNVDIRKVKFNEEDIVESDKDKVAADTEGDFCLVNADRKDAVSGMQSLVWKDEKEDLQEKGTISLTEPDMDVNYLIVREEGKEFYCDIKRRPIYLKVSDGIREYGTDFPEKQKKIEALDYSESQKSGILEGDEVKDSITVTDTSLPDALVKKDGYGYALKPLISDENSESGQTILDNKDTEVNSLNKNYYYKIGIDAQGNPLFGDLIVTERTLTYRNIQDFVTYGGDIFREAKKDKLWVRGNSSNSDTTYGILVKINSEDSLFDSLKITKVSALENNKNIESKYEKTLGSNRKILFNTLEKSDCIGQEFTFELYKEEVLCSKPYTQTVYVDVKAPEVNFENLIGENTPLDSIINAISFGNYKNTLFSVPVTVNDQGSGEKNYDQVVLDIKDDLSKEELCIVLNSLNEDEWERGSEDIPVSVGKGKNEEAVKGYYVIAVRTYDNLGNTLIYVSNGIVIENKEPSIELPADLDYKYNQKYLEKPIEIEQITVTDYDTKETEYVSSGINNIRYVIYQGTEENKISETTVYSTKKDTEYSYKRLRDKNSEPLKIAFKGILDINNLENKEKLLADHNDVYLKVIATDNSGKTFSAIQQLTIDLTSPEVEVRYIDEQNTSGQNNRYFQGNRKAVLTIKDRNIVQDQIYFDLALTDKKLKEIYTLDSSSIQQLRELTDATPKHQKVFSSISVKMKDLGDGVQQMDIAFVFNGEDRYEVNFSCTDGLGNKNDGVSYSTDATEISNNVFVIDKTSPVVRQVYTAESAEILLRPGEMYYIQTPVYYTVYIDEHNFADKESDFGANSETKIRRNTDGIRNPDNLIQDSSQWTENGVNGITEQWKYTFSFETQGIYRHFFEYKDLAGNPAIYVDPNGNEISDTEVSFTIDWTPGTGSVSIKGFGFWETFIHKITFGLFTQNSSEVEVTAEDDTSPLYGVQYFRAHDPMSLEQLKNYDWSNADYLNPSKDGYKVHGAFTVNPDEQFVVYLKVIDYAKNVSYFSSDGMILDNSKSEPAITITNLSRPQNGIFNEDVNLQIDVEDPYAGETYSGLERVWYTLSASGNVNICETVELLNNSGNRVQGSRVFSQVITVPANIYNSNDVKIQTFAEDFSGNQGKSEITKMKIDVTDPVISVSWDLNNPQNGKYYKDTRTATVTVTDRNFDPNNVRFSITNTEGTEADIVEWSSSPDIGVSDSATSTCQVIFPADGDYTFTLSCTDLAGNRDEYGKTDEFTIDKIMPEIFVSYDNNSARNESYYDKARTATITVREHNFNDADVKAVITASLEEKNIAVPVISEFSGSGDVHTATVTYGTEGDYTFDVEYTDMAGNAAAEYVPDDFTVDFTGPEIEILDIQDKSANNDVVSPRVKATDVNYDTNNVTVTISGVNNGKVNIKNSISAVENGQVIKFDDFKRQEKMDDLYTLTASAVDMAGNEKKESVIFSVNRYGSVYVLDSNTKSWLSTKNYTYTNEEKEIGLIEYNVDTIKDVQITMDRDGDLKVLKAMEDYKVISSGTEEQWKENYYILNAENFETEGHYTIVFCTRDKAGNVMNNTSVKRKCKNFSLEFAVDKTSPTAVISGVEDGGFYGSTEKIMTVDAKDNLALAGVTVTINGKEEIYRRKELKETDGRIDIIIASSNNFQKIEVTAFDAAGNVLGKKQTNDKGKSVALKVLVTSNAMVHYYTNKSFFYAANIGIIMIFSQIIFFIVWKTRKQKNRK